MLRKGTGLFSTIEITSETPVGTGSPLTAEYFLYDAAFLFYVILRL